MNKYQKLLVVSVAILTILNLALIGFIWNNRPQSSGPFSQERSERPSRDVMGRNLHHHLDLTDEQAEAFRNAFRSHQMSVDSFHEDLAHLRAELNNAIMFGDSTEYELVYNRFHNQQAEIDREYYRFIRQLSSICTEEQKRKLTEVLNNTMEMHHRRRRGR